MHKILTDQKERLEHDLNETLTEIKTFPLFQDIEVGITDEQIQFNKQWIKLISIAENLDYTNYYLRRVEYIEHVPDQLRKIMRTPLTIAHIVCQILPFIYGIQLILNPAFNNDAQNLYADRMFNFSMYILIAIVAVELLIRLMSRISMNANNLHLFLLFNANKKMVQDVIEERLPTDYTLQQPTILPPLALTSQLKQLFKRNRMIALDFVDNATMEIMEIREIKSRLLSHKSNIDPSQEAYFREADRLLTALDNFHTGKPIIALNNLLDLFSVLDFQSIADPIISQILLLLTTKLPDCSKEQKRCFYQLMAHCSKEQPNSPEFLYASSYLQQPDREHMPIDRRANIDFTQSFHLSEHERLHIINSIASIFPPEKSFSAKNNCGFFDTFFTKPPKIASKTHHDNDEIYLSKQL